MSAEPSHDAATQARVLAALLAAGVRNDHWSLGLTLVALATLLWLPLPLAASLALFVAVPAGAVQRYLALRVEFDRRLFAHWAQIWSEAGTAAARPDEDMAALDRALADCGLRAAPAADPRPLRERLAGARTLLQRQTALLVLQFAALAAAAGIAVFAPG